MILLSGSVKRTLNSRFVTRPVLYIRCVYVIHDNVEPNNNTIITGQNKPNGKN